MHFVCTLPILRNLDMSASFASVNSASSRLKLWLLSALCQQHYTLQTEKMGRASFSQLRCTILGKKSVSWPGLENMTTACLPTKRLKGESGWRHSGWFILSSAHLYGKVPKAEKGASHRYGIWEIIRDWAVSLTGIYYKKFYIKKYKVIILYLQ